MSRRDHRNAIAFNWWLFAWVGSWVGATMLIKNGVVPAGTAAVATALAPNLLGLGAVWAQLRFLRETDELVRRIHIEALAWGFAAGSLFAIGGRLLERAGAVSLDVADTVVVMFVAWSIGVIVGTRRYL